MTRHWHRISNGEPEVLPIYADPDNVPRDEAIGDEHAATPGEPAPVVLSEGGSENEGEESGGMIVAGGVGSGRPRTRRGSAASARAGSMKGRACPGSRSMGWVDHPCHLLPAAPAADLSGGGKIAGDPIFDVKEIGVALDQLAREILRHLKDHKLTVVWLFDESTSMQDDQRTILEKFDRVSSEFKLNIEPGKKSAGALNHAIVGFGQGIDYVLEKPREDIDQIGKRDQAAEDRPDRHREHDESDPRRRRTLLALDRERPQVADRAGDRRIRRRRCRRRGGPAGTQEVQGSPLCDRPAVALRLSRSPTTATSTRSPKTSITR